MSTKLRDDYVIQFTDGSRDRLGVNLHIALGVIATHIKYPRKGLTAEPIAGKPVKGWLVWAYGIVVATVSKEPFDPARRNHDSPAYKNVPKFTSL